MRVLMVAFLLIVFNVPAWAQDKFLDIKKVTSEGGITAWLVEDHTLPIISLQFAFRDAGAANDPVEKQGLTQLLSNTMDEGAGELDSQAFQKTLSDNSITLRFDSGRDSFGGNLKTLTRTKNTAFDLLHLALTQPRFDAEAVERMRESNLLRIRSSLSEPTWKAARLMNDIAYDGHPYALNSGGTLSTLPAITPADLRNVVKTRLGQDRLLIGVTGDITADELKSVLDGVFGELPKTSTVKDIPESSVQHEGEITLYKDEVPQSVLRMQMPAFGRDDPDYYALQVMNHAFGGGGFGSRLTEEIRETRGLTYGIYSSVLDTRKIDTLSITTSTKNENVAEMMALIDAEMQKIKTDGLDEQEMKNTKDYLTGSLPLSLTSTDSVSGMLVSLQMKDLPADYLDQYRAKIEAVGLDDVKRAAERVLNKNKATIVIVGQPENIEPTKIVTELPNVE